jgi:hypothetical protein
VSAPAEDRAGVVRAREPEHIGRGEADVCTITGGIASRPAGHDADVTEPLPEARVAICKSCGDECGRQSIAGPRRGSHLPTAG